MNKKYIHYFETEQEFYAQYNGDNYYEPWVSYIKDSNVSYNKNDMEVPLTFRLLKDGDLSQLKWFSNNAAFCKTIQYSYNNGEWKSITAAPGTFSTNVETGDAFFDLPSNAKAGDTIKFKGDNPSYGDYHQITSDNDYFNKFSVGIGTKSRTNLSQNISMEEITNLFRSNGLEFEVYGNIMSLINSTNFSNIKSFASGTNAIFKNLFVRMPIVDASKLILPATTLNPYCYALLFKLDTLLQDGCAPKLPADTLAEYCYQCMFQNTMNLHEAPLLPAVNLAPNCYNSMFNASYVNNITCLADNIAPDAFKNWVTINNNYPRGILKCTNNVGQYIQANNIMSGWTIQYI